jgi:hypothetical protein
MAVENNEEGFSMEAFESMGNLFDNDYEPQEIEIEENTDSDSDDQEEDVTDPKEDITKPDKKKEIVADEDIEDEDEEDTGSDDDKGSSPEIYSSLADALAEEGILSSLDLTKNKIKNAEDLFQAIKNEIKNNEYSDLTEDQREYLEAIRSGVPLETYKGKQTADQQLNSITPEELEDNAELRKAIITNDYITQGISPEKAAKLAQRSVDLGEDKEDALESLSSLKEFNKKEFIKQQEAAKQARLDAEKAQKDQLEKLKETVYATNEIIPGMKLNAKVKEEVFNQMTKPVGKDAQGNPLNALTKARMEDPVGFTTKMHYLFHVTKGFTNFDKIVKTQKSKAVKDLEEKMRSTTFISGGNVQNQPTDFDHAENGFNGLID